MSILQHIKIYWCIFSLLSLQKEDDSLILIIVLYVYNKGVGCN